MATGVGAARRTAPRRILVAEDSAMMAAVIADALAGAGYEVARVADGRAAMDAVAGPAPPDLLLTDGQMPQLDGLALCAALRARGFTLPIIVLTSDAGQLRPALDAGADDFVRKPFVPTELLARVRSALRTGDLTAELSGERDRYAALMGALRDGVMVFDGDGRIVDTNPRLGQIAGVPHAALVGAEPPFPFWPPEHAADYEATFRAALGAGDRTETDRVYLARGRRVDVIVSLAPVGNRGGQPMFVSTVKDVTARRTAERALRVSEARHRALADEQACLGRVAASVASSASPRAVFDLVAKEVATLLGAEAGGVTRYETDSAVLVGRWSEIPDLRLEVGARLPIDGDGATARVLADGAAVRIDDYERFPDAWLSRPASLHMSAVAAPVRVAGQIWGNVGVVSRRRAAFAPGSEHRLEEFAELVGVAVTGAHARAELARQALTDPLTGVMNRRGFSEALDAKARAADQGGGAPALVMLDVDHFKRVNDLHGHSAGDAVLCELAARLEGCRHEGDLLARVGGEEFALLLTDTDAAGAGAGAERLRAAVASRPFAGVGPCTISLGVAVWRAGDDADALMRRADAALYRAKEGGRDRVAFEPAAA